MVVLGQQRLTGGLVGPASLREARRGMALAAELRLPLVLVIDTAGPALSAEAEQGGLAGQIAQCLAELVTLDTPTVSVLLGQGSGGPALAMVPADRVLAALHGWLARCRRRAPARSSSATPTTPRNWLRHKASGRAICWRRASST
ncbi:carboxyl transferase domain protein [Mycobacterium avium subsp. avium 2285 (R)]|nr:carboxyl transferase domain protein [Mycobacterium avium subsp. avium 2285 (R)]